MAKAIISSVAERIGNLLAGEAIFLYQVKGQVSEIQNELRRMQCFLEDADSIGDKSKTVSNCISEIRKLAYRVEDVLEVYVIKIESRRNQSFIKRFVGIFSKGVTLHKIGSEIKTIKIKITDLTRSLQTYYITRSEGSSSLNERRLQWRRTYCHVIEEDFVGFDEDIRKLVAALLDNDKEFRAMSICGMGGLGKTTLARKIYQHEDVRRHFDAFAWVCISQDWNNEDVLQCMLANLKKGEKIRKLGNEELVKAIFKIQELKKCLVVLDDVWSTDLWDMIRSAFPNTYNGSKILLTSRTKSVATHIDPFGVVHEPCLLDEEKSWELFRKKALLRAENADSTMEQKVELGRKILKKCGGLPLAIIVLGGILLRKHSLDEWVKVHKNVDKYTGIGKRLGEKEDGRGIQDVLPLSYHNLPYRLKPCFLYLSFFPEDCEIETDMLYQLWMAEGFLSLEEGRGEETMMDVGEYYLGELAQRCMVQVQIRDDYQTLSSSRFKSCRLHDLMRDMCLSQVKEENFLNVMDCRNRNIGEQHPSSSSLSPISVTSSNPNGKIHRFAIYCDEKTNNDVLLNILDKDTRSIIFFPEPNVYLYLGKQLVSHVAKTCKSVRVLVYNGNSRGLSFIYPKAIGNLYLKPIGNLIHLRYLSLRYCEMLKELPSSIGKLRYLETLDLRVHGRPIVPNVLWKLRRLVNLYLPRDFRVRRDKLRLKDLINLENLENFDSKNCCVEDLYKLTKLQKLINMYILESASHVLMRVVEYLTWEGLRLKRSSVFIYLDDDCGLNIALLRKLFLQCHHLRDLEIQGPMSKIFEDQWDSYSNLTYLHLERSQFKKGQMVFLEKFPNLIELSLAYNAFKGSELVCSAHGFPRLRVLTMTALGIEEWRVDEGAMPSLSSINIRYWPELKKLPDGLRFITTLQELEITGMPQAFRNRLKLRDGSEGQDFDIIRHIPSITFHHDHD